MLIIMPYTHVASMLENDLKMIRLLEKVNHQIIEVAGKRSEQFRNVNSLAELNELNTKY